MYTFSDSTVAEFYGRQFYSILRENGEVAAYSDSVFEVPEAVTFPGEQKPLIFEKAVIRGGEIWGGEIWGGEIWGGVIRGGEIWGGVIRGGVIWGGEIWGGVIRGGVITKTLLQIQGSRHYCYATPSEDGKSIELGIGCKIKSIAEWQAVYQSIGADEDYSQDEIAEYAEYIALFASRYPQSETAEK